METSGLSRNASHSATFTSPGRDLPARETYLRRRPHVITAATSEEDPAGASGIVVCGFRSTGLDDGVTSKSITATGSYFVVFAEGHPLTGKHVVE